MKKQEDYKRELLQLLRGVGAVIIGENDDEWLVHFEINGIPHVCLYDDGISCFSFGTAVYSPLEWGEPYFTRFRNILTAVKN